MGSTISLDAQQASLDDLLAINPVVFGKTTYEPSSVPFSHHLRVWRFQEDAQNPDLIKSLSQNLSTAQTFKTLECYVVLLISQGSHQYKNQDHTSSIATIIESLNNLTPRGLENAFSTDDSLGNSILLSKNELEDSLHYFLYVWNGKRANPMLKAFALTKGFELENHLSKGGSKMLRSLFCGAWVKNKKVQQGNLVSLNTGHEQEARILDKPDNFDLIKKLLWPESLTSAPVMKPLFPKFREHFLLGPGEPYFVSCTPAVIPQQPKVPLKMNLPLKLEAKLEPKVENKPEMKFKLGLPAMPGLKLKTDEPQANKPKYNTKEEVDKLDENFELPDLQIKEIKLKFYDGVCSQVDEVLFVGSDTVARDIHKLKENGITHIINCAGNVCKNYFPDDFTYLTFFLKDSKTEPIEAIFYTIIEFIENAVNSGGKVYVHCMQGVSRSVTVCLAYIIFKQKKDYETVYKEAKQRRGVCSPNISFQIQLMWWYRRLYENFDTISVNPRVFAVCSHQIEQPRRIIARLLMQNLYTGADKEVLDSRGVFIIQTENSTYIWEGKELNQSNRDIYLQVANRHVSYLIQYEKSKEPIIVVEGQEPDEFWQS